jgi:hypothetical protein
VYTSHPPMRRSLKQMPKNAVVEDTSKGGTATGQYTATGRCPERTDTSRASTTTAHSNVFMLLPSVAIAFMRQFPSNACDGSVSNNGVNRWIGSILCQGKNTIIYSLGSLSSW